jgi:class 3 adenylate cyclase
MFADMVGFTSISERLGEEGTYAVVQMVLKAMADAVSEQGGSTQDFAGDGVLALFGVPDALENGPLLACRAGLLILQRLAVIAPRLDNKFGVWPQVRIGINSGPVVVASIFGQGTPRTALGDVINVASRLQSLAEPDTVVLSESTFELVDGLVEATFVGALTIKGKAEPQKVWRLDSVSESMTRFDVAVRHGLTPYVGRERELEVLERGLASTKSGHRAIEIVADPGMGKSRLLYEFRRRVADSEVAILSGNCSPMGQHIPFLPFIEVVRETFRIGAGEDESDITRKLEIGLQTIRLNTPENQGLLLNLLGLAPPAGALSRLDGVLIGLHTRDLLVGMLDARCRLLPVVLLIEDLHWIDSASQQLLGQIIGNAANPRLRVVYTRRPGYEPPWRATSGVETLVLERLATGDVRRLIQRRLGLDDLPEVLVRHVTERAEGNALFAEEILSFLSQRGALRANGNSAKFDPGVVATAVPASLHGLLSARVDRLAPRDRTLLQAAAAIGRQFDPTLLAAIANDGAAVEARLAKMAALDLVYLDPQSGSYSFKHAMVRDSVYQSLLSTTRAALHLKIAVEIERRSSNRLTEVAEALAHHYGQTDNYDKAFTYLTSAGVKSLGVYSLDEADQYFAAAAALVEQEPGCASDGQLAEMLANYALCSNISLKLKQIIDIATRFEMRLGRLNDCEHRILILYHYVQTLLWSSKFKQAEQSQRELTAMAERLGDARARAYALVNSILVSTHVAPKPATQIRADTLEALAAAESANDAYLQYNILAAAGWDELNRGLITEATLAAERMLAAGHETNDARSVGYALALKALIALMREDYPATLEFAEEAIGISRIPFDRETAHSARCAALVLLHRPEAMDTVQAFLERCSRNGWYLLHSGPDDLWGVALILSGEVGGGLRYMNEAILRRESEGYQSSADWTRMFLCEIYLRLLSRDAKVSARVVMKNFWTLARLKLTARRQIIALVEKVRSNPQFDSNGIFVARCEMILGLLSKAMNQRSRAIKHLLEAKRITSQFGASPILARIDAALLELNLTRRS